MPPKSVYCAICHQTVLKAQTLETSPGVRACRHHSGVAEQAEQKQQTAKETEQHRAAEAERKRWRRTTSLDRDPAEYSESHKRMMEFRIWTETHCWTCGSQGISLRDYFFAVMVANKRLELTGRFNFLTMPQDIKQELGNPTVLAVLPYHHGKDHRVIRVVVKDRLKEILPLLGLVQMCGGCIGKYRVEDRLEALLPHPTMEQIENMMPFVALLDPVLTKLATEQGEN